MQTDILVNTVIQDFLPRPFDGTYLIQEYYIPEDLSKVASGQHDVSFCPFHYKFLLYEVRCLILDVTSRAFLLLVSSPLLTVILSVRSLSPSHSDDGARSFQSGGGHKSISKCSSAPIGHKEVEHPVH